VVSRVEPSKIQNRVIESPDPPSTFVLSVFSSIAKLDYFSGYAIFLVSAYLDRSRCFHHTGSVPEEPMATLNIKNMPDRLYRKIQARAYRKHRSIAQEVIHILSVATENAAPLSILELQGLGKDAWKKVDAGKLVNRERREWD
jgi:antitoxin FitA-like protein